MTLPYPPSANRYWRVTKSGRIYVSTEATEYKSKVRWVGLVAKAKPLDGPVRMSLAVYRPRAVGDLSNRIKVLEDSLRGIAFHDDDQVVEIRAIRLEDKANPRVEVTVEPFYPALVSSP
jgi:crossover junction endodeoxyribonuclease RusA